MTRVTATDPGSPLTWSVHLARRRPRQAAAAVALIVFASLAAGIGFRSALLGVLACALLTASIGDFLFPLTFSLTDDGVEVRGLLHRRRMAWSQVRRMMRDELGVKLSPLAKRSRLDAYRGIYLWFEGNADDVMTFIAHHTEPEAAGGVDFPSA
jgi:hypothetical protein